MAGAWTNNWMAIKRIWATGAGDAGTIINTGGGTVTNLYPMGSWSAPMRDVYSNSAVVTSYVTVRIGGQESTPTPSASDYNIYGPVTSGISYVNVTNYGVTYDAQTGIASVRATVTIQNTQAGTKTIREWGLFGGVPYLSGNNQRTAEVLLYRGTLDEPVTLAQYETITIDFTRQMQITA